MSGEPDLHQHTLAHAAITKRVAYEDEASMVLLDDDGNRWRVPRATAKWSGGNLVGRGLREVATERDLLHVGGTFFELPANNAGGYRKLRPIASHDFFVHDFCSYRGLLVMSGVDAALPPGEHIVRATDGKAALWVGVVDDLWQLGHPRGRGGPWWRTEVAAGVASDAARGNRKEPLLAPPLSTPSKDSTRRSAKRTYRAAKHFWHNQEEVVWLCHELAAGRVGVR